MKTIGLLGTGNISRSTVSLRNNASHCGKKKELYGNSKEFCYYFEEEDLLVKEITLNQLTYSTHNLIEEILLRGVMEELICIVMLGCLLQESAASRPTMPELKLDFTHIKTPQLIGIIFGCIVFIVTIGTVVYLLYASGTLSRAWSEIVQDAQVAQSGNGGVKKEKRDDKVISPFQQQPELYDHLIQAKATLPSKLQFRKVESEHINIRELQDSDIDLLLQACNGSPQYHESAYEPIRIWAWADWTANSITKHPWSSTQAFKKFLSSYSDSSFTHLVIVEKVYNKPIGLISLTNNSPKSLSITIGKHTFSHSLLSFINAISYSFPRL
jgi:hypothetical protein